MRIHLKNNGLGPISALISQNKRKKKIKNVLFDTTRHTHYTRSTRQALVTLTQPLEHHVSTSLRQQS